MNTRSSRLASLTLALCLTLSPIAAAKGENTMQDETQLAASGEHFTPENPDQMPAMGEDIALDLTNRNPVFGQAIGEDLPGGGVRYAGGTINKSMFPLPFSLEKGQTVMVTVRGRFNTGKDDALRVYLTDGQANNCTEGTLKVIVNPGTSDFTETFELEASAHADRVMLASSSFATYLEDFTLLSITVNSAVGTAQKIAGSWTYEQAAASDWYQTLLTNSHMNLGNNLRLKQVIARAQAGERVTIATIGGSITEGAGANRYQECYAYQIFDGFRKTYGVNGGENVSFVNAGVGGTPSTFGYMRYGREIVGRVNDDDGLPDIVIVEYAVNDGGEPTRHRCYESMVKEILEAPNHPAVILLFSVFPTGYTLQQELKKVGEVYDLMMVSILNGAFPYVGDKWTSEAFFYDIYHPTTLGHHVMADCVLSAIAEANALPTATSDVDLTVAPAYGTDFMGLKTIFKDSVDPSLELNLGGFAADDTGAYRCLPVGRVCGANFHHTAAGADKALTFSTSFKKLLIAYRATGDASFGDAEVYVDGKRVATLKGNTGSWGQSVVDLLVDQAVSETHTVEIRMAKGQENKKFTITCIGYVK